MRKRTSKRRIKARILLGRWVSRQTLEDCEGLAAWIKRRNIVMTRRYLTDHYRRVG